MFNYVSLLPPFLLSTSLLSLSLSLCCFFSLFFSLSLSPNAFVSVQQHKLTTPSKFHWLYFFVWFLHWLEMKLIKQYYCCSSFDRYIAADLWICTTLEISTTTNNNVIYITSPLPQSSRGKLNLPGKQVCEYVLQTLKIVLFLVMHHNIYVVSIVYMLVWTCLGFHCSLIDTYWGPSIF